MKKLFLLSLALMCALSVSARSLDDSDDELYPINFDKSAERTSTTYSGRQLTSVSLDAATHSVPNANRLYTDLTAKVFVAAPGATVDPSVGFSTSWMNTYVYIDFDHSGTFDVDEPLSDGTLAAGNELVSYAGYELSDGTLRNSAGEQLSNLSGLDAPAFTLPADLPEGYYVMRFKVDYNSIDPGGRVDADESIVENNGGIVDVRLLVTSAAASAITAEIQGNGTLTLPDGTPLDGQTVSLGQPLTILAQAADGFVLQSLSVRHGNLGAADSIAENVAQYVDEDIDLSNYFGSYIDIPATLVDGDMTFTATFAENTSDSAWVMIFNDEFNQPDYTQPDTAKWTPSVRYGSTWNRFIAYSDSTVFIRDGALVCRALRNGDTSTDNVDMLSGAVETRGLFSFTYGRVDIRLKTNLHTGNFPAAWMMPQPPCESWPNAGEIDIFESVNAANRAYHTVHSNWTYNLGKKYNPTSSFDEWVYLQNYHVYSLEWDSVSIKWLVDGDLKGTYAKSSDESAISQGQWPFTHDFYIILNQSVGDGSWASSPDLDYVYETSFDYVRVYQKQPVESTGITEVSTVNCQPSTVYDLQGRRLARPQRGVNIIGGRKYIVR